MNAAISVKAVRVAAFQLLNVAGSYIFHRHALLGAKLGNSPKYIAYFLYEIVLVDGVSLQFLLKNPVNLANLARNLEQGVVTVFSYFS